MSSDAAASIFGLIMVALPVISCCMEQKKKQEKAQKMKIRTNLSNERRNTYLREHKLLSARRYTYSRLDGAYFAEYVVDEKKRKILVSGSTDDYIPIPFDEITGCEIIINDEVTGGIGRAIAGGILAGGSGAIVGAVTANKKISTYQVIIYRNNLEHPKFTFYLIIRPAEIQFENDKNCKNADNFARNVNASIKAIISQRDSNQGTTVADNTKNVSARLKKLENLKDKGLISEAEYNTKRQKILDDL